MFLRELKKGDYFTLKSISRPFERQVWVLDSYDCSTHKFLAIRFSDISDSRLFPPNKEVFMDFIFLVYVH